MSPFALGNKLSTKHGLAGHPLHGVWKGIKQRCYNPRRAAYPDYGGRGITVCDEWLTFEPFYRWAIERWQPGLHIDRIDNDGPYSPSNCQFVTQAENNRNRVRKPSV